jgi:hypothetical protein
MSRTVLCRAGLPTTLVQNIAARGRLRTFVLRLGHPVEGTVAIRRGPLPFFIAASHREVELADGLEIKRGFFDASFEIVVTPRADAQVRVD